SAPPLVRIETAEGMRRVAGAAPDAAALARYRGRVRDFHRCAPVHRIDKQQILRSAPSGTARRSSSQIWTDRLWIMRRCDGRMACCNPKSISVLSPAAMRVDGETSRPGRKRLTVRNAA